MTDSRNNQINPADFIITRKRKLYKFAAFQTFSNCYSDQDWAANRDSLINNKKIVLEIGAGTALFSTKLAKIHPDFFYIAMDRKSDRLYKGAKLAIEEGINNIVYLWSNARNLVSLLPGHSVSGIWITFPDPWPQDSNAKHRLTNPQLLKQYQQLLKPGGKLNFKTDNRNLFDWSVEQLKDNNWQLNQITYNLHNDKDLPPDNDALIMTTYEERYVSEGKPINYLQASLLV